MMLIDSYENYKRKGRGIDEWDEEAFEREERRHHARRGFELMYRNLMDGGRVPLPPTIEYMQQYGVHPQVAMTEVSGYIQHTAQRIKNHELPHSNDLEEFAWIYWRISVVRMQIKLLKRIFRQIEIF